MCLADMHNPVRISVVKSALQEAKRMEYLNSKSIALVVERGKKAVTVVEIDQKIALKPSTLKKRSHSKMPSVVNGCQMKEPYLS